LDQRQQILEDRRQQEIARQQADLERQRFHMVEFFRRLACDIREFGHLGQNVLNREMQKTINGFYPLDPGYYHDWQVSWEYVEDGKIRFVYFDDQVRITDAEANRQNMQALANQIQWSMFFDTIAITSAIRHSRY
jgi:hypothetical protein